ncbi:RluA family pseudouridine synthase [Winogradskyella sp. UBA3174]|uniref:RluA family pseudouridine synthase n=1 Tax=Winogradskyella sp. UBA3174 TaxID=1947785 RepID=UPI0025E475E3|nr:RluA family pseudouridine synthase [Winogradskyella sp. UBA3174]|tara:strand:- start:17739 stop:19424 length:1686 start_codon:yes stop_codon:yes gene_type:complete
MFASDGNFFHSIDTENTEILPKAFTYPFYYTPHPLTVKASEELQDYLMSQSEFNHNFGLDGAKSGLKIGKMFGVMVVKCKSGKIGYLAAFSGKLAEHNFLNGFVPPIYDNLNPDGFYKLGEAKLNVFNSEIEVLEANSDYLDAKENIDTIKLSYEKALENFKAFIKFEKKKRNEKRIEGKANLSIEAYADLIEDLKKQSIYYHFRLRDLKKDWNAKIKATETNLLTFQQPIDSLKAERKVRSAVLQKQLHEKYRFLNHKGTSKDLIDIFNTTDLGQPPAGAGECAAPKLFQFAYKNEMTPIAMAEFWWGSSPKSEVRKHKQYYPSCRGKCEPILGHMMQGLNVEPNPILTSGTFTGEIEIVYEDDSLLVLNKPNEFLSVPGKTIKDSVLSRMKAYLPNATGPLLVHRLDMSTSGLLIVAKNERIHKHLQKQFIKRTIKKRYVALLEGELKTEEGTIDLPLRVDLDNRPRQLVCYEYGKAARTQYEVLKVENGKTRIHFYPISGRTHQLRVHAAHYKGLNMAIVGDDLYGVLSNRLHLHAEWLSFEHPMKKEQISFTCNAPF